MDNNGAANSLFPGQTPEVTRYDVGRRLGRGGSAEVWLGTDLASGQEMALKCLTAAIAGGGPPEDTARNAEAEDALRREVRILSVLDHEHLVRAHGVIRARYGREGVGLGLVLDY